MCRQIQPRSAQYATTVYAYFVMRRVRLESVSTKEIL